MTTYNIYKHGQITKFEAGVFYRNYKSGNIEALPEFATTLYNEAKLQIRFADERYTQNCRFYDRVYRITELLLDENFEEAQEIVNELQEDMIRRAGKRSIFHKYQEEVRG